MNVPHICPRCNDNWIPNNRDPGKYPGALSRADNKTEICSPCGEAEALQDWEGGGCTSTDRWPVRDTQ
jgi:hypothetical protein